MKLGSCNDSLLSVCGVDENNPSFNAMEAIYMDYSFRWLSELIQSQLKTRLFARAVVLNLWAVDVYLVGNLEISLMEWLTRL